MKKTNPLSVVRIKNLACQTRDYFKIDSNTYFPILPIIERMVVTGKLNLEIVEDESLKEAYALYDLTQNTIFVRESVYNECYTGEYRSNFTLAHEFFHYIQGQVLNFSFEEVDKTLPYCDPEWQANEYAAQLLIPDSALELSNAEIVSRYHVSLEFVLTRKLKAQKRKNHIKSEL